MLAGAGLLMAAGCAAPSRNVSKLRLGDTPEVILEKMGKPTVVRAAKVYEDESTLEIWEYLPGVLSLYPKSFWVFLENGRMVQWGEPGDFAGKSGTAVPANEYSNKKRVN